MQLLLRRDPKLGNFEINLIVAQNPGWDDLYQTLP